MKPAEFRFPVTADEELQETTAILVSDGEGSVIVKESLHQRRVVFHTLGDLHLNSLPTRDCDVRSGRCGANPC